MRIQGNADCVFNTAHASEAKGKKSPFIFLDFMPIYSASLFTYFVFIRKDVFVIIEWRERKEA